MQDFSSFFNAVTGQPLAASFVRAAMYRQLSTERIGFRLRVTDTQRNRLPCMAKPSNYGADPNRDWMPWDATDISPLVYTGNGNLNVAWDGSKSVQRSLKFSLYDPSSIPPQQRRFIPLDPQTGNSGFPFNPDLHLLECCMVVQVQGVVWETPLGHYCAVAPSQQVRDQGTYWTYALNDLSDRIRECVFVSPWIILSTTNTDYISAATALMTAPAMPVTQGGQGKTPTTTINSATVGGNADAGPEIPASMIDYGSKIGNAKISWDIPFQARSSRIDAINALHKNINYWPLLIHHRQTGQNTTSFTFGSFQQQFWQTSNQPVIAFDFSNLPNTSILDPSGVGRDFSATGQNGSGNYVVLTGTGSTQGTTGAQVSYRVEAINNSPNSLISTANLKNLSGGPRVIPIALEVNGYPSTEYAQLAANVALQQAAAMTDRVQFSSWPVPLLEAWDCIILNVTDRYGTTQIPSSSTSPYLVESWSLDLGPASARQQVTARKIILL